MSDHITETTTGVVVFHLPDDYTVAVRLLPYLTGPIRDAADVEELVGQAARYASRYIKMSAAWGPDSFEAKQILIEFNKAIQSLREMSLVMEAVMEQGS